MFLKKILLDLLDNLHLGFDGYLGLDHGSSKAHFRRLLIRWRDLITDNVPQISIVLILCS